MHWFDYLFIGLAAAALAGLLIHRIMVRRQKRQLLQARIDALFQDQP